MEGRMDNLVIQRIEFYRDQPLIDPGNINALDAHDIASALEEIPSMRDASDRLSEAEDLLMEVTGLVEKMVSRCLSCRAGTAATPCRRHREFLEWHADVCRWFTVDAPVPEPADEN
jgi:hypothetical protein